MVEDLQLPRSLTEAGVHFTAAQGMARLGESRTPGGPAGPVPLHRPFHVLRPGASSHLLPVTVVAQEVKKGGLASNGESSKNRAGVLPRGLPECPWGHVTWLSTGASSGRRDMLAPSRALGTPMGASSPPRRAGRPWVSWMAAWFLARGLFQDARWRWEAMSVQTCARSMWHLLCLLSPSVHRGVLGHPPWCPPSHALCSCSPGPVSLPGLSSLLPSLPSASVSGRSTLLMAGQHLSSPAPAPRAVGAEQTPHPGPSGRERGSHWRRGWPLGCCFDVGFSLPVRPGTFSDRADEAGWQM